MHKTKTGRWQPDPPPPPEPAPAHTCGQPYEAYLIHRYSHLICDHHPDCPWCANCAACAAISHGAPFAVLNSLTLR